MSPTILALLAFIVTTLAATAVAMTVRDMATRTPSRLDIRLGLEALAAENPMPSVELKPLPGRFDRAFYNLLEESGSHLSPTAALLIVAGLAIVACGVPLAFFDNLPGAVGGLLLGAAAPLAWWKVRRAWRQAILRMHLPETLELLADGARAGRNLEQAVQLVAEQAPKPVDEEFAHCASQLRLGHSPVAVMERMARRIPMAEFKVFATAVLIHRRTGGNLAMLTDRLADAARDRLQFRGHLRAVTAGSKLSAIGLLVGSLSAVVALYFIQPEYLEAFFAHRHGITLLSTAAILQLVGIVWAWRILNVQY